MTDPQTPNLLADYLSEALEAALDDIEAAGSRNPRMAGVPTGFADLDALTGGLRPGTLTVIAGRPSMGRTTLLSDICRTNAIGQGTPVAVYTLEEGRKDFATRVIAAEARVAQHHLRSGLMTDEDWTRLAKKLPEVNAAPLLVNASPSLTAAQLAEHAAAAVQERGVRLVAVDGIQDIRPEVRSDLREREVGDSVRALKTLARELDVPVLATSHLNRGPEQRIDKRPIIDDLRESGAVTYAADTIILLFREDAYARETPRAGEADLIVAKHRFGPVATVTVAFQGHYGRFVDIAAP